MGLLDDAIREHLELKRQRGADAAEIDRLEHEALGPVRRHPLESPNRESVSEAEVDDRGAEYQRTDEQTEADYEEYYDEEDSGEAETGDWGEPFEEGFERPGSRASRAEPPPETSDREPPEPPSAPEHQSERGFRRWRRSRRESVAPEDAPPTQAEPPERPPGGDETVEYDVEDTPGGRGEPEEGTGAGRASSGEDDDVLEETPEFLQDAPEHDRLWFEQRPPRDFDFDD
jgi:hypothetical protein